jgi:hypothetical protein
VVEPAAAGIKERDEICAPHARLKPEKRWQIGRTAPEPVEDDGRVSEPGLCMEVVEVLGRESALIRRPPGIRAGSVRAATLAAHEGDQTETGSRVHITCTCRAVSGAAA